MEIFAFTESLEASTKRLQNHGCWDCLKQVTMVGHTRKKMAQKFCWRWTDHLGQISQHHCY